MEQSRFRQLDSFGRLVPFVVGLLVGGAVAFVYDGPYEFLPVAAALAVVAIGQYTVGRNG